MRPSTIGGLLALLITMGQFYTRFLEFREEIGKQIPGQGQQDRDQVSVVKIWSQYIETYAVMSSDSKFGAVG